MVLKGLALFYLIFLLLMFISVKTLGGYLVMIKADHVFLFVVSLVVILGRGGSFIMSLSRYFILIMSFEAMRGVADDLNSHIDYATPLLFDRFLGGGLTPTEILQMQLAPFEASLGLFATLFYTLHFFVPFLFGALLWYKRRTVYEPYFLALIIATYLSLVTFLLMPVAPPWMASEAGLLNSRHILFEVAKTHNITYLPTIYYMVNANPVAAFPSVHVIYPLLVGYFGYAAFGRKGLPFLLYPLLMAFSTLYLGEHYLFDMLGSLIYAAAAILLVAFFLRARKKSTSLLVYSLL